MVLKNSLVMQLPFDNVSTVVTNMSAYEGSHKSYALLL